VSALPVADLERCGVGEPNQSRAAGVFDGLKGQVDRPWPKRIKGQVNVWLDR